MVLGCQTAIAFLLAIMAGRMARFWGILIVMSTTVIINLLFPQQFGPVMFTMAGFPVYRESLITGLQRALTLGCLFFLSKAFIRPDLRLPGTIGRIMAESMGFLSLFLDEKLSPGKNIISRLDAILFKVQDRKLASGKEKPVSRTTVRGFIAVFCVLAINVIFLILEIR
ncbi:MAG: hypothetical protein EHM28_02690 [Spirochaetaceae bacterium]|nr:MAG: hypothetical protein EHM28_02690 [Spirochaetaceae bacterium]